MKLAADCNTIDDVRAAIDALDRELIALLATRAGYIRRAAEIKRDVGLPANIPARVEDVVAKVRAAATAAGLDADTYERMWRILIAHAIAMEEEALSRPPR